MKKITFNSYSYFHNLINEDEFGNLLTVPYTVVDNGEVEAEIIGESNTRLTLLLNCGKIIKKRKVNL